MLINFISNLPPDLRSGGFSAMNAGAFRAISSAHSVHYVGPISLAPHRGEQAVSRALRLFGMPGSYFQYSPRQLARFAAAVSGQCDAMAELDFFHGFTPWIAARCPRPYAAWSDCTFADYVRHYNRPDVFHAADLARIKAQEAVWLQAAQAVGFTSQWAAERAISAYALDPARVHVLGIFGEAALPEEDGYRGGRQFAFISTDFAAKGGAQVLEAFRLLRAQHSDASLVVVGDAPAARHEEPGVIYAGFLRKEVAEENARFASILATSRAVVLPTRSDIAPLLLVEAAHYGCPAIASRRFAIGEIVVDGKTGMLLDDPEDPAALADAMRRMLTMDEAGYQGLRAEGWARARNELSRTRFDQRLLALVAAAAENKP